jgi:hypothetical protein
MVEDRSVANKELKERYGLDISGESRRKLNDLGYVKSVRQGRGNFHTLDEQGWSRCKEPLTFIGVTPRAAGFAMNFTLALLQQELKLSGRSLAMAIEQGRTAPTVDPAADLVERIRAAYKAHATEPGAWVSLADVRDYLGPVGREEVDAALKRMEQQPDINIVPQANEKALSDRTKRAAVTIGGQRKHFIVIGV